MQHRLNMSTEELIVVREALHAITIKGKDAPFVAGLLDKIYKGINKAVEEQQKQEKEK